MERRFAKVDHGYDPLLMASVMALAVIGFGVVGSALYGNAITPAQVAQSVGWSRNS